MGPMVQFCLEDGFLSFFLFFLKKSQKDGSILSFNPVFVAGGPKNKHTQTYIHTNKKKFSFGKTVICLSWFGGS